MHWRRCLFHAGSCERNCGREESPVCKELIISGGIKNFLDGYYLVRKSSLPAIYGMASTFLKYAREDYAQLKRVCAFPGKGLEMAYAYLIHQGIK